MLNLFKIIGALTVILVISAFGFMLFTHKMIQEAATDHMVQNLSQIPTSDVGYAYIDQQFDKDELAQMNMKFAELLDKGVISELYLGSNENGFSAAEKMYDQLQETFGYQVQLLRQPGKLSVQIYNLCMTQHNCTMTLFGRTAKVQQALYVTNTLHQQASGYVPVKLTGTATTINDLVDQVKFYFSTYNIQPSPSTETAQR